MSSGWYSGIADELARCLVDARACAKACEALLERTSAIGDDAARKRILDAVLAPAAVARVLVDLVDQPQQLLLAAAALCRDTAEDALAVLQRLPDELVGETCASLRACATSCGALLAAA